MSKVWLITGSSRGLGRALAKAVLASGDRLVATARRVEDIADLRTAANEDRLRLLALDVTSSSAARAAVSAAEAAFGRLDVLVNNAGYANVGSIEDTDEDDFRAQLETNLFGVVNMTRAALPLLRAQGAGHIIQISSVGGRVASPGLGAYQTAKWAVGGFSEVLAKEVGPLGIRVTVVEPGGMRTDWSGSSMRVALQPAYGKTIGAFAERVRGQANEMRGDPDKVARAIVRVAAEADPPLRLLAGTDAAFFAKLASDERATEDARWRDLSRSTDFDGLLDFAETPVAKALSRRP